jgi:thiol:disulfide interchange protein
MDSVLKKHFITNIFFVTILAVFSSQLLFAAQEELSVELIPSKSAYKAGDSIILALKIKIPEKYHLYGNPLGPGIGKPLMVSIEGAEKVVWDAIRKPAAKKYKPPVGEWVFAYDDQVVFYIGGNIPQDVSENIEGVIHIEGLICNTACIPVKKKIPFNVSLKEAAEADRHFKNDPDLLKIMASATGSFPLVTHVPAEMPSITGLDLSGLSVKAPSQNTLIQWNYSPLESRVNYNLWLAVLFGFLAGIIMNVMPCVLPVLGIKILSFSEMRQASPRKAFIKSLVFSAGMLSVFLILASLASFANFSWGEQFRNPAVLVVIIAIIVIFALGMFDLFMIQVPSSVASMGRRERTGLAGDFLNGMFATILATPCSGPLLGATLAWTLTQKPLVIFTIFSSIGLGMAFPYILISLSGKLARTIPKPGKWMNDFKYLMGFILLGFAVYLMAGLPQNMMINTVGMCLVLVFAVTFFTRYAPFGSSIKRKTSIAAIALIIAFSGVYVNFGVLYRIISSEENGITDQGEGGWREFSVDELKKAHERGQNVMIDFTANWCVNCQFNKVTVLHTPQINNLIKEKNIVALRADLTRPNPQIESLLYHLGSRSVPFLAIFSGSNPYEPIIMRDIISKKKLVNILEKLE